MELNTIQDLEKLPIKVSYVVEVMRGDWKCDQWLVAISSKSGVWTTDYFTGLGHRKQDAKPSKPETAGILHSLIMDGSADEYNFADWCCNCGYSDDSIKALNLYKQCLEIGANMRKHFGREAVTRIAELLRDY